MVPIRHIRSEPHEENPMADPDWTPLRDRLARAIATLEESEVVALSNVVPPEEQRWSEPRRGLLGRREPEPLPSGFMVQVVGQGQGVVQATCEGPVLVGGHLELTEAEDAAVRALGWKGPADPGHYAPYAPAYTVTDWPRTDADELARIAVEALEIEHASPTLEWTLEVPDHDA